MTVNQRLRAVVIGVFDLDQAADRRHGYVLKEKFGVRLDVRQDVHVTECTNTCRVACLFLDRCKLTDRP